MQKIINPKSACGTILAIPSKSAAHRALICAALADKKCMIICAETNKDIEATAHCLNALGAHIERTTEGYIVEPLSQVSKRAQLDCGESGSTLRFMLPVAAAIGAETEFIRRNHLKQRPLSPLYEVLCENGAEISPQKEEPLWLKGKIKGGSYQIDGSVSSQYISGLLMALPLLGEKCTLEITGKIESEPYIRLTLQMMEIFGVQPRYENRTFYFDGVTRYQAPEEITVEGDWSNAAFFLAMGALGSADGVGVTGLNLHSAQGDSAIADILAEFGAEVTKDENKGAVRVKKKNLHAIKIDAAQIPDLVPILAVVAAAAEGVTEIYHAERLRIKECDRLQAMYTNLSALGVDITETAEGLKICGGKKLVGAQVDGFNDHRIVMSMAAAALLCEGNVIIDGAEAVAKSYPKFWEDWAKVTEGVCG